MLLTISADDFGLHPEIDSGIIELIEHRIVGATSVLIGSPLLNHNNVRLVKKLKVSVGVHLAFTEMPPLCPDLALSNSWMDPSGTFIKHWKYLPKPLLTQFFPASEVEREWNTQITQFTRLFGMPDFLDSHQNLHLIWPFSNVAQKVLVKNNISKLRVFYDRPQCNRPICSIVTYFGRKLISRLKHFPTYGLMVSGKLDLENVEIIIKRAAKHHSHIALVSHPGSSRVLTHHSAHHPDYELHWREEYELLRSKDFRLLLDSMGVRLAALDGTLL